MLAILGLLTQLGSQNVSAAVLVEAWQAQGRVCDDVFFVHFDVLSSYQFVQHTREVGVVENLEQLLQSRTVPDELLTITHAGVEFLHRYGRT